MIFWALVVVVGSGLCIGALILLGKAKARAKRAAEASLRQVPQTCRSRGHSYQQYAAGYRCAVCGNYVSSHEGELYGVSHEGRVDRRRDLR